MSPSPRILKPPTSSRNGSSPSWMQQGLCLDPIYDPEMWFPIPFKPPRRRRRHEEFPAVLVCQECPVASQCLDYALENKVPFGIWGGVTAYERARLRNLHTKTRRVPA